MGSTGGPGRRRRDRREETWVRAGGLLVGSALFLLGLLGFVASALALPAAPAVYAIRGGRSVTDEQLARAVGALERSLRWGGTPAVSLSRLAALKLVQARSPNAGAGEAHRLTSESAALQEKSLARAPADTDGWARLAYARYALSGLDRGTRDALAMSFHTGRLERAPMLFRLELVLREWDALDPQTRALGELQIRRLASYDRRHRALDALVDVYLASGRREQARILATLKDAPEDRRRFEERIRWRRRHG